MPTEIPRKFKPLFRPKRYKVFFGGRGGVKSWSYAQALAEIGYSKPTRILCTREYQKSIEDSVHRLLQDTIQRIDLDSFYEVLKTSIKGGGSEFVFSGLKNNPTQIKSYEGFDIVWVEEAESISDKSWDILIPTIRKPGSEIWISFNPDDAEDPTYTRFVEPYLEEIEEHGFYEDDHIYVCYVGYWDNPWFDQTELKQEMETCKANDPKKYQHIWRGKPDAQNEGSYYSDLIKIAKDNGRICSIPIDPSIPVDTFWDLGRNDTTVIWFMQRVGKEYRFIDHYEMNGEGLSHYARILKEKGYYYGKHYLPHDVEVTELTTNKSRKETLEGLGVAPIVVVPRVRDINEGIEMTRQKIPMSFFDETRCKEGIRALMKYKKEWDDKRQVFRSYPLHDWSSNSADAFRQFAQGYTDDNKWHGTDLNQDESWVV